MNLKLNKQLIYLLIIILIIAVYIVCFLRKNSKTIQHIYVNQKHQDLKNNSNFEHKVFNNFTTFLLRAYKEGSNEVNPSLFYLFTFSNLSSISLYSNLAF